MVKTAIGSAELSDHQVICKTVGSSNLSGSPDFAFRFEIWSFGRRTGTFTVYSYDMFEYTVGKAYSLTLEEQ